MTRPAGAARRKTSQAGARAESQRERILDAAQKCFIERGFHAASIASIAKTAGMSAGLMYRYFENKNAIVKAIIERELEGNRAKIAELYTLANLLSRILGTVRQWQAGDPNVMNAALYLEMSAEAAREPEIAQVIRSSDALARRDFERWLCRSRDQGGLGLPKDVAHSRAILMQCVIGGLALRAVREPDLDPETLSNALDPLLRYLELTPADGPPAGAGRRDSSSSA